MVEATVVRNFQKVWDDAGTKACPCQVSLFKPLPPVGYGVVSHVAVRGHVDSVPEDVVCLAVKDGPAVAPPTDYVEVWNDHGTRATFGNMTVWRPVPPPGYGVLGVIVSTQHGFKPSRGSARCIHLSLLVPALGVFEEDGNCMWMDRCSGGKSGDFSMWSVAPEDFNVGVPFGGFWGTLGYARPRDLFTFRTTQELLASIYSDEQHNFHAAPVMSIAPTAGTVLEGLDPHYASMMSMSVNMSMYQSVVPPPTTEVVAQEVDEDHARELIKKWRESRWFAPSDFSVSDSGLQLRTAFHPFFLFTVPVTSKYEGAVHVSSEHPAHNTCHNDPCKPVVRRDVFFVKDGSRQTVHYVSLLGSNLPNKSLVHKFETWDFSKTQTAVNVQGEPAWEWNKVWQDRGVKKVIAKERKECTTMLREGTSHQGHVENISCQTTIGQIQYRVIYVPIIEGTYNYAGKAFQVYVHGQTGEVVGSRPYGLGTLSKGLTAITGTFKKDVDQPGLVTGDVLRMMDGYEDYVDMCHMVFPGSGTILGIPSSTGFLELKNTGSLPMELRSRRRNDVKYGASFELGPNLTVKVPYKGNWCIEILAEYPSDLTVVSWGKSGGDGLPNLMGMVNL